MREHAYIYSFLTFLMIVTAFFMTVGTLDAAARDAVPLRDPTTPPNRVGGEARLPGVDVSSVIYGEGRRVAVVNNIPLAEGEEVDGIKVVSITKTGVTVRKGNQKYFLPVIFGTIKQAS